MNVHDIFVKALTSRHDPQVALARFVLPPELLTRLDVEKVRLAASNFVNRDGKERLADIVLYIPGLAGEGISILFVLDHKSGMEYWSVLQLLAYVCGVYEGQKREGRTVRELLDPVFPVILYHGKEKWTAPLQFAELVNTPDAMKPFVPSFRYKLCDLSTYSDEELSKPGSFFAGLLALKHVFSGDMASLLDTIFRSIQASGTRRIDLAAAELLSRRSGAH